MEQLDKWIVGRKKRGQTCQNNLLIVNLQSQADALEELVNVHEADGLLEDVLHQKPIIDVLHLAFLGVFLEQCAILSLTHEKVELHLLNFRQRNLARLCGLKKFIAFIFSIIDLVVRFLAQFVRALVTRVLHHELHELVEADEATSVVVDDSKGGFSVFDCYVEGFQRLAVALELADWYHAIAWSIYLSEDIVDLKEEERKGQKHRNPLLGHSVVDGAALEGLHESSLVVEQLTIYKSVHL